jgi:hypothetical protein
MIPKSYSDDANLISSLLDDLELERKKSHQHARKNSSDSFSSAYGNSAGRKDLSEKGDHLSENGGKKQQLKSGSSVEKTESFDTTSTNPCHEMNISPLASSSPSIENKTRHVPLNRSPSVNVVAHGSEQLEIVVHSAYNDDDTTNSSCSKDRKAKTITE